MNLRKRGEFNTLVPIFILKTTLKYNNSYSCCQNYDCTGRTKLDRISSYPKLTKSTLTHIFVKSSSRK